MFSNAWMRLTGCLLLAIFCTACSEWPAPFKTKDRSPRADRQAPFDPPSTYPEWAYDAPEHAKPVEDLTPEPRIKRTDPLHYFTNEKVVMVRQPAGYTPEETPRVALWWTDNNGFHWQKAGYFGREQSFFPFEVTEDGDYGVRFVGPGQAAAVETPAYPERVYHVDTALPEVEVSIEPNKSWYSPGDQVTIGWRAADYHLVEYPVQIGMLIDYSADEYKLVELQRDLANEGSITYQIPQDALDHEIRFRVEATDRAGNLGLAFSYALQVVDAAIVKNDAGESMTPPTSEAGTTEEVVPEADACGPPYIEEQTRTASADIVSVPFATEFAISNEDDALFAWSAPFFAPRETDDQDETLAAETKTSEPIQPIVAVAAAEQPAFVAPAFPVILPSMFTGEINAEGAFDPDVSAAESQDTPIVSQPEEAGAQTTREPDIAQPARIEIIDTDFEPQIADVETTPPFDAPAIPVLEAPSIERIDPTHGNGILIPLPATVAVEPSSDLHATAHPWRILIEAGAAAEQTVWALPTPRSTLRSDQLFQGRMFADNPALRPVAEPGDVQHAVAGLTTDTSDVPPIDLAP